MHTPNKKKKDYGNVIIKQIKQKIEKQIYKKENVFCSPLLSTAAFSASEPWKGRNVLKSHQIQTNLISLTPFEQSASQTTEKQRVKGPVLHEKHLQPQI